MKVLYYTMCKKQRKNNITIIFFCNRVASETCRWSRLYFKLISKKNGRPLEKLFSGTAFLYSKI